MTAGEMTAGLFLGVDGGGTKTRFALMRNAGGNWPRRFVSFNVSEYLNALRALDGQPVLDENGDPTGAVFDSALTAPELNPVQSYDVEEDTIAAYLNANFKSDKWFANLGVRWISTDTTAKTAVDAILFVDDPTPGIPTSSPDVTYSPAEPLTQKGSYSKLLPSFNFGYWLREDLIVRAAIARTMSPLNAEIAIGTSCTFCSRFCAVTTISSSVCSWATAGPPTSVVPNAAAT